MRVFAIDPGFRQSGWVLCEERPFRIIDKGVSPNEELMESFLAQAHAFDMLLIEHIAMGGMIAGQETFDTCFIAGRFAQAVYPTPFDLVKRLRVKLHLCGQARAKDANVRQALIDRFGGSEAIGKKKTPGPLYGVFSHMWQALAVAVTWSDETTLTRSATMAPREGNNASELPGLGVDGWHLRGRVGAAVALGTTPATEPLADAGVSDSTTGKRTTP